MNDDAQSNIWQMQTQFNTQGLVDHLYSDDAGIRRRAAAALRALGAFHAIPEIENALENEADPETRSAMLAAIATLNQEQARRSQPAGEARPARETSPEMQRLIDNLKSDDHDLVMRAAINLGKLGDKIAVEPLVMVFNNPQTPIKVRLAVAEALLKLESAPVEVALLGALRSPEWRVRRNGAAILGQLKADWAVEPLIRALRDENEMVRRTALAALKSINTAEARRALSVLAKARRRATQEAQMVQVTDDEDARSTQEHAVVKDVEADAAPDSDKEDTQRIAWPSRDDSRRMSTTAPTAPLNPDMLDIARQRAARKKAQTDADTEKIQRAEDGDEPG